MQALTATKYYSIKVDATPDSSHVEQTSFILRYVHCKDKVTYEVQERFLEFVDCNQKTGESMAEFINETLRRMVYFWLIVVGKVTTTDLT